MAIQYLMDEQGGFLAGDGEVAYYAYPSSPHADMAKRKPAVVARRMTDDPMSRALALRNIGRYGYMAEHNAKQLAKLAEHGTELPA